MDESEALLARWRKGDEAAKDQLFSLLFGDLSRIASILLKRERQPVSLSTGDLVNESIVRILTSARVSVSDKNHLLSLAARVMRQVLVDLARRRMRNKRDGVLVSLTGVGELDADADTIALDRALTRLSAIDPGRSAIVEMRYFGGMTVEEIADVLAISPATVKRRWEAARIWLRDQLLDE